MPMIVAHPLNARFFTLSILVLGLVVWCLPVSAQVSLRKAYRERNSPQENKVAVFLVSQAGKDKSELMRVFAAVQKLENAGNVKLEDYQVSQRINLREFLVYKKSWLGGVVASRGASSGNGGGVYCYGGMAADTSTTYWLKTKDDHDVADKESLSNIITAPTGKTREYTSVLGAKMTCREMAETDENVAFSKEDFLAALKGGKTWTLKNFSKSKCSQCSGTGKLSVMKNYAKCPDCKGNGEVVTDCLVKW